MPQPTPQPQTSLPPAARASPQDVAAAQATASLKVRGLLQALEAQGLAKDGATMQYDVTIKLTVPAPNLPLLASLVAKDGTLSLLATPTQPGA